MLKFSTDYTVKMLKSNFIFYMRQHVGKIYLQPKCLRYLSGYSCNDQLSGEVNDAKQSKRFKFWANLGLLLGGSLVCYDFFKRRESLLKTKQDYLCKTTFPKVQAAEPRIHETFLNEKVSPRNAFNFLADVAEKTAPAVVYIEMVARHPITKKNIPISNGSGFIVRSDGLILTNAHVVSHHGRVIVKLFDGKEYDGTVEHYDTESDLATVRIKANELPVLPLGQSSKLRTGEFVIAMGNPLTLSHTITAGVVSSANRPGKDLGLHKKTDYIQTDAAVNVGNSGGPLVNLDCEAIGINTMKVTEGISFAIPSDQAVEFLKRTESEKKSGEKLNAKKQQKYLGITMLTLTPSIIRELQERTPEFPNVTNGVMVWRVMYNSPSHEAGIKHGDVITAINGKEVKSATDIYAFLKSEDILTIRVIRRKKEFDIVVKLMDPVLF